MSIIFLKVSHYSGSFFEIIKNVKKLRVKILSGFCVDRLFKNIEKMTKLFQNHKNMNFFKKINLNQR